MVRSKKKILNFHKKMVSPFVLHYINEVILGFSRLEDSVVTHRESKGSSVTGVS
jgi:hypothetical protein